MQSLAVEISDNEKIAVGNELEKLFAVHDRPLPTGKKAILVQELVDTGYPIKAISAGIRKLMHEDLRSIRLLTLIEAAQEFLETDVATDVPCDFCNGSGLVMAHDEMKYQFSLACLCPNGGRRANALHLVRWQGSETQRSRGRMLMVDAGLAMA